MQPIKLLALAALLLATIPGDAAYVQSGVQNFGSGRSTVTCSPGNVTAGDLVIMAAFFNTGTSLNPVTSTRVTTWIQYQHAASPPNNIWLFYGIATSSGAETISVSMTSGTTFAGSICAEYTNTDYKGTNTLNITTTVPITDIIAVTMNGNGGACTFSAPFNNRQGATSGTDVYMSLGDRSVTSTGTYTPAATPCGPFTYLVAAFAPGASVTARHQLLYK